MIGQSSTEVSTDVEMSEGEEFEKSKKIFLDSSMDLRNSLAGVSLDLIVPNIHTTTSWEFDPWVDEKDSYKISFYEDPDEPTDVRTRVSISVGKDVANKNRHISIYEHVHDKETNMVTKKGISISQDKVVISYTHYSFADPQTKDRQRIEYKVGEEWYREAFIIAIEEFQNYSKRAIESAQKYITKNQRLRR